MPNWTPFIGPEHTPVGDLYHNSRYHVFVRRYTLAPDAPRVVHLSIRDNERTARHDWRELQRIKNELVGPEIEMVEIFPRESHLVDLSNQFHLWGFDTKDPVFTQWLGLGFMQGRNVWNGDPATRPDIPGTEKAVQRPIES